MASQYRAEDIAEARRQWVEEGKSARAISAAFGGKPSPQTVLNWANRPDADGLTWDDHRDARADALITAGSPATLALRLMEQIERLASTPSIDPKQADALAKYVSSLRKLTDPTYQASMIYQVLTDLTVFTKRHYPAVVTEDWVAAMREFKSDARRRLGV